VFALHHKTDYRYGPVFVTLSPQVVPAPPPAAALPAHRIKNAYSLKNRAARPTSSTGSRISAETIILRESSLPGAGPSLSRSKSTWWPKITGNQIRSTFFLEPYRKSFPFAYDSGLLNELSPKPSSCRSRDPRLSGLPCCNRSEGARRTVGHSLVDLISRRVQRAVRYCNPARTLASKSWRRARSSLAAGFLPGISAWLPGRKSCANLGLGGRRFRVGLPDSELKTGASKAGLDGPIGI